MAKKKIILKSIFKAKLTKAQIVVSLLFIIFLFTYLGYYSFSSDTVLHYRMMVYSQLLQEKNNYIDYMMSFTPTPKPQPAPTPIIVVRIPLPPRQVVTPSRPNKLVVPNISPDKLIVFRPEDKIDNLPELTRTITDPTTVKKLYDEIYSLPLDTVTGTIHCPIEFFMRYTLIFSLKGNTVFQATFNPTGCRFIQVFQGQTRWALGQEGSKFIQDLQDSLNLSNIDFYGSHNGRPLRK